MCFGMRCRMKVAEVMRPSHPSFCTPGSPPRNLSVTSLPSPSLRRRRPSISSSASEVVVPRSSKRRSRNRASAASWMRPRLWSRRSTSSQSPSGVTMRQLARLSSAVPHSTAFLPPAFIATLPPMHEASADVGSTAKTSPFSSAASITRLVTTPAPQRITAHGSAKPGRTHSSIAS